MLLWDIIRDFFVRHVFGGVDSNYQFYQTFIGQLWNDFDGGNFGDDLYTGTQVGTSIGNVFDATMGEYGTGYITISDWLSTTATIITLVALFIGITLLTIKLFKYVSNLFLMR